MNSNPSDTGLPVSLAPTFVNDLFLDIVSVGALPVSDRDEWLRLTKDSPSVVKMVLAPISELFEPSYINHIDLYPHYPSRGFLDADLLKRSFTNIVENYCQFMLGEVAGFLSIQSH